MAGRLEIRVDRLLGRGVFGDIGGTNARFAMADPVRGGYRNERVLAVAEYATAEQAIHAYLESTGHP
ncbi:MAG: glucokinase, partial [Pseudomonadota bacterium]